MGFHRGSHGLMMLFGIFLSYAMTQVLRSRTLKTLAWASAPLLIVALLFTWSRAAALAMAVASISLIITMGGARAVRGILLSVFGVITIAYVLSYFPDVYERVSFFRTGDIGHSGGLRLLTWGLIVQYLFASPSVLMFGAGFQNFHYFMNLSETAVELEAAHNGYLHVITEHGIFGFAIFAAWLAAICLWLWRWRRQSREPVAQVTAGVLLSMMIAMVVSSLTQESLSPSFAQVAWLVHFYLILGMWISWYRCETTLAWQRAAACQRTQPGRPAPRTPARTPPRHLGPADAVIY